MVIGSLTNPSHESHLPVLTGANQFRRLYFSLKAEQKLRFCPFCSNPRPSTRIARGVRFGLVLSSRMPHPFDGIYEKLNRADQNIVNLNAEINAFIAKYEYSSIPDDNSDAFQKAMQYYNEVVIPPRFAVLSGEIIHHFRSCLDHIVWHFSSESYRKTAQNAIGFPVFESEPRNAKELARYERNIEGVTKQSVRQLIESYQPYKTPPVETHALKLIHDMDRFDKHRELAVTMTCVNISFADPTFAERIWKLMDQKPNPVINAQIGRAIKNYGKAAPQIAFSNFANRKVQAITPALVFFLDQSRKIVDSFAKEI
jgi:hypothetical protein